MSAGLLSRAIAAAVCLGLFGAGNACNVYTTAMLLSAAGGGQRATGGSGGQAPLGGGTYGGSATGGNGIGGNTPGTAGGMTQATGGAVGGVTNSTGGVTNSTGGATLGSGGTATGGVTSTTGGATPLETGGAAGQPVVPTGGAATGGVSNTAVGGGIASGGSGTAGRSSAGTGGAIGVGGATPCDPTVMDDMRDANAAILVCGPRNGTWYTFGSDGTLQPPPKDPLNPFKKVAVSASDEAIILAKYEAKLQGSTTQNGDCGLGFTLSVENNGTKNTYPLAGTKISFKYRTTGILSDGKLSLAVPLTTTTPSLDGGTCSGTCYNHYAFQLSPSSGPGGWRQMDIPFVAGPGGFAQNTVWNVNIVPWDPTLALMIQFTVSGQSSPYTLEVGPIQLNPA